MKDDSPRMNGKIPVVIVPVGSEMRNDIVQVGVKDSSKETKFSKKNYKTIFSKEHFGK